MRVLIGLLLLLGCVTNAFAQAEPLQPGDKIQVSIWQDPKLDRQLVVGPDGMISFPLAGHIRAAGMTTLQLENMLKSRLQKNYNGALDITVSLADINQNAELETKPRVYITGEVVKPGFYYIKPRINIVQGLALAGGLSPFAAKRRIQVHRKLHDEDTIYLFNYGEYQAGMQSEESVNLTLRPGDIIIVPERGLFE